MGFFSFLSRKSHDKGKSNNTLKSQNYSSTSSGALPVQGKTSGKRSGKAARVHNELTQSGPYPVAGNGPKLLESLTRPCPEFSQTHSSLATDHTDPAPSPAVPRFREEALERPSTAPNGSNSGLSWSSYSTRLKRGSARGAPPVSFRMFKGGSAAQEVRPSSRGTDKAPSVLHPTTASVVTGHSRASSIRSENGRGFKDILDAQSEIRPADFRTRVKAAGARDYGEDVADRNLGQNGFNLEAPEVQAFYAQSSLTPAFPRPSKSEYPLGQIERKASSYGNGLRTRSLTSSTQFPILNKLGAQSTLVRSLQPPEGVPFVALNSPISDNTKDTRRRQSVNTFMPAPMARGGRSHSADRTARFSPPEKRRDSLRPPSPSDHPASNAPELPSSPRPDTAAPVLLSEPLVTKQGPLRPAIFPRDSVLLAKQRADKTAPDHMLDEANFSGGSASRKERSFSLRSSSVYTSRRLAASAATIGLPRKRHSLHALQSSILSPAASRAVPTENTPPPPLAPTQGQQLPASAARPSINNQTDEQEEMRLVMPSVTIERAVTTASAIIDRMISSSSSQEPFTSPEPRTLGHATGSGNSPLETADSSHSKTRSLRALSASSATATVSDASSNLFQRPQSRHTANSSVDLSAPSLKTTSRTSLHITPPAGIEDTIPALPASINLKTITTATTTATITPGSPTTGDTNAFNIDDYLSSDDDSITGSRHPRGEGEEDLLFNDSGYGADGMQLPGLFDSLALTSASRQSSQQRLQRRSSSPSFSPPRSSGGGSTGRAMIYTGDSFGRAAGRRYIIDTGAADDEEEEDREYAYENDNDNESDSYSDAVAYPMEDGDDDADDADSLYSRESRDSADGRRRESGAGIRSPPLLQPSRVINRLSAIIHPYHPQHPNNRPVTPNTTVKTPLVVTKTTPVPRPSSAHFHEPPRHAQSTTQPGGHGETTEVIDEELAVGGTGVPTDMSTTSDTKEATSTATAVSTQEITTTITTTATAPAPALVQGEETTTKGEDERNKRSDLIYKISDISAAMKLRKETKAKNRAAGAVGTGATKMSNKSRWSIATSITSSVGGVGGGGGGVATAHSSSSSSNSNKNDDAVLPPRRNKSVSSTTSSVGRRAKNLKMKETVVKSVMNDACRDAKGKKEGIVQVGVHEVGLGLGMDAREREKGTTTTTTMRRRGDEKEEEEENENGNQADVECV